MTLGVKDIAVFALKALRKVKPKVLVYLLVIPLLGTWASGSLVALRYNPMPDNVCQTPYKVWAITWPVWKILPDPLRLDFAEWSISLCHDGKPS